MAASICSPSNKGERNTGRSSSLLASQSGQSWTSGFSKRNNQSIGWGMIEKYTCHWSLASLHTHAHTQHTHMSIYRHMLNYIHTPQTSNAVPILKWNAVSQSFGVSTKCKQAPVALGACLRGNIPCSLLKPRAENNSVSVACIPIPVEGTDAREQDCAGLI